MKLKNKVDIISGSSCRMRNVFMHVFEKEGTSLALSSKNKDYKIHRGLQAMQLPMMEAC